MRPKTGLRLATIWLCCLLVSTAASAAPPEAVFRTRFPQQVIDGQPVLVCTRVQTPPKIDGEVDRDPVWPACGHTQGAWVELATKNASARQTVVYACYDERAIYLGFVCEEPELNHVRMDGNVQSLEAGKAGPDDSVEAVFEIGGLQGDGATYAFRANSRGRLATMGFSTPYNWVAPAWESAGKFGPNRWMQEFAIPFQSLKSPQFPRGVSAPMRGDIWGIKLARYGGQLKSNEQRMTSTFNVEIPYPLLYICGYNGLLYFEDANCLRDGDFAERADKSPWKAAGPVKRAEGSVTLDAGATLTQQVTVRPSSFYLLNIQAEGKVDVLIDGVVRLPRGAPGSTGGPAHEGAGLQAGFWTGKDQKSSELTIGAAGPVTIKRVEVRYQPGEEPPGIWCLTNNYRSRDRNIRSLDPGAPEGSYRYVEIDYTGRVVKEDHPSRVKRSWAHDPTRAVLDVGGTEGWIPFSKGSLTGKPFPVFWQTVNPEVTVGYGRHEHATVDIDLGRDYFVRGLDVLWPAPYTQNVEIWGKPDGAAQWTYLYTGDGPFVEPAKRRSDPRGYITVRGLDSVVRHLRWRSDERHPSYPQMDGIQKFWVWGEPKGEHASTEIKPFKPWVSPDQVPPVPPRTWTPDRESAQIVPRPRTLERKEGWFVVDANTRIVAQDSPAALQIAGQIRDEIRERWKLDLRVVKEDDARDATAGVIYLGRPGLGDGARKLAAAEGLDVDADKPGPQGYGLAVTPKRVVVLGRDDDGLYWGVQSLMQACRWRNAGEGETSGPALAAMRVLDWPGTPERAIYMHKGYSAILNVPQSEIGRVKKLFHLLSRFKFNVVYVNTSHGDGGGWAYAGYGWKKGTLAKLCREIRDEYHIEIRPIMPPSEGMSTDWWRDIIRGANDWSMGESDPDELAPELGGHVNICPLHPRTLPLVFDKIDRTLEEYGWPSTVWLWDQAYVSPTGGGRWAQCRRCQKSGKTPDEIYVWFASRIVEHLESRQTKARFKSSWLRLGEREEKERRKVAVHPSDLPGTLRIDLDSLPQTSTDALAKFLDPKRTANGPAGWPSVERSLRGPWTETEVLHSLTGGGLTWGGGGTTVDAPPTGNLAEMCEVLWYAPQNRPDGRIDIADLCVRVNEWWFGSEFPSWRNGTPPTYHTIDLRPFANHVSHATGVETLKPGHPPEFDLRYLKPGKQMLGGCLFDIIDPAENGGRGVLMMGRPPDDTPPDVAATVVERAGPIPVGRKLASLAFLRARWQCALGGMSWHGQWLRPTCRVVYDDGTWLVADAFSFPHEGHATSNWNGSGAGDLYYRAGWVGNTPTGSPVGLVVVEWVNPYPSKTIRELDFFTPDMEDVFGKRVNNMCEAMVAIGGVEPTGHDLAFWADRSDRPPLLPPRKDRPKDIVELKRAATVEPFQQKGTWGNRFTGPTGPIAYTGALVGFDPKDKGSTGFYAYGRYEGVRFEGFGTFGATLTFDAPTRLERVELIGPMHDWGSLGSYSLRRQKVDVTVEVSRDGNGWEEAGVLRGISAQADFLPVELPDAPIRAIRLTGTAAPYHNYYHPTNYWGGMFNRSGSAPHFAWRLFAPANRTVP